MTADPSACSPLTFFWESVWPRRPYQVVVLLILVFSGAAFWLAAVIRHPDTPLDVLAMFRNGGGSQADTEAYPLITRYLRRGEQFVYEAQGSGVRPESIFALLPHGVLFAGLGISGIVLADVLVQICYYGGLCALVRTLGVRSPVAEFAGLFAVAKGSGLVSAASLALAGKPWLLFLGDMRLPRPFVTDIFFLLALAYLVLPFVVAPAHIRRSAWALLGFFLGAVMQGDPTSFMILAVAAVFPFTYLLVRLRRDGMPLQRVSTNAGQAERGCLPPLKKGDRGGFVRMIRSQIPPDLPFSKGGTCYRSENRHSLHGVFGNLILLTAVCAVTSLPFVWQRLGEHPDVPRRLGVFPVSRSAPLISLDGASYLVVATIGAALVLLIVAACRPDDTRRYLRAVVALWLTALAGLLALPVSCVVLGKAAQTAHFGVGVRVVASVLMLLCGASAFDAAATFARQRFGMRRLRRIAAACVCGACVYYSGAAAWRHAGATTLPGFIPLAVELHSLRHEGWQVMGTFDFQVALWWTAFAGGYTYFPDCSTTTLSDDALEERFASFGREIGMDAEGFRAQVADPMTRAAWLGALKYQGFQGYALAPLDEYADSDRAFIERNTSELCWSRLVVPRTTEARWLRLFDAAAPALASPWRLDLIVLRNDGVQGQLAPPAEQYDLIYTSDWYRAWQRRPAVAPAD
jgi:hypothetical protein